MSKLIDLTGQTFGYWKVLERGPNDNLGKAYWLCICTACGKKKLVSGAHLRSGHSTNCGCVRMQKMWRANIKDETNKTYGYLKVIRMATKEEKPRDVDSIYWVCNCLNCGRQGVIIRGDYLRNGDTISCGCINSKNESIIAQILTNANITFQQQYTFDDLTSTGRNCDKLLFDFAIFNNKQLLYLIEYDGEQHFHSSHYTSSWNTAEQVIHTHQNDLLKNKYCFTHNIPLIRIPYNVEYTLSDLLLTTTRFLLTQDNEEQYYILYTS